MGGGPERRAVDERDIARHQTDQGLRRGRPRTARRKPTVRQRQQHGCLPLTDCPPSGLAGLSLDPARRDRRGQPHAARRHPSSPQHPRRRRSPARRPAAHAGRRAAARDRARGHRRGRDVVPLRRRSRCQRGRRRVTPSVMGEGRLRRPARAGCRESRRPGGCAAAPWTAEVLPRFAVGRRTPGRAAQCVRRARRVKGHRCAAALRAGPDGPPLTRLRAPDPSLSPSGDGG